MSNIGSVNFTYDGTANLSTFNAAFVRVTGFTQVAYVNSLNYAYLTESNIQAYYYFNSTTPSADYSVSVDGILNSVIASNEIAALFRVSTTESTFYKLGLTSAGALTLTRRLAGANSVIGTGTVSVSAGNTYNVKIEGSGDQISGYVNGVLVISPVTNADITAAGRPGCALIAGGGVGPTMSTGWALDNLSWDTIETAGTSAQIAATTDGSTASIIASVSPLFQIAATSDDSAFSGGSQTGYASAQISATTDASVSSMAATVPAASGTFVTEPMINNTGAVQASVSVVYEWRVGTGVGVAPTSVNYGTGTTNASGVLTATGLIAGSGELWAATTDRSSVYFQAGTVS